MPTLEERVARLEAEVKRLAAPPDTRPWWEKRFGAFADDPLYEEAMKAGAEYRRRQLPDYMQMEKDVSS